MATPKIEYGKEISEADQTLLSYFSGGRHYERAYHCGSHNDGVICLMGKDKSESYLDYFYIADSSNNGFGMLIRGPDPYQSKRIGIHNEPWITFWGMDVLHKYDSQNKNTQNQAIEIIHRNEPKQKRQWREEVLSRLYRELTPAMEQQINVVDFNTLKTNGAFSYHTLLLIQIGEIQDIYLDEVLVHEATHLFYHAWNNAIIKHNKTENAHFPTLTQELKQIFCVKYIGDEWIKKPPLSMERYLRDGTVSPYCYKNILEHLAEVTAYSYTMPGIVRWQAMRSLPLRCYISLAAERGIISQEQKWDLLDFNKAAEFEKKWQELFHEGQKKLPKQKNPTVFCSMQDENNLLAAGFVCPEAAESWMDDLQHTRDKILYQPDTVRDWVKKWPDIRKKVDFLYENKVITKLVYDSIFSDPGNEASLAFDSQIS